jgi:8-oxo-dGTP diphosphatase
VSHTYEHPRPALTVDCVVFGRDESNNLRVLLIRRGLAPFNGEWALPGGFVKMEETLEDAARRELEEEAGLTEVFLEQLYTFGAVHRDPRERIVSVAYYALVNLSEHAPKAATDAADAKWTPVSEVPKLAFDHDEILRAARDRLRAKVRYEPIGFELLPERFTLGALQRLYEAVLERPLDKRNFRKKIGELGYVVETDEMETGVSHRPSRLFRFDERKYRTLKKQGHSFEL